MNRRNIEGFLIVLATLSLAACGGDDDDAAVAPPAPAPSANVTAATTTATSDPLCAAIGPFYWEIGDKSGIIASGSIDSTTPDDTQHTHYDASTTMAIASASKWMYSSYVLQQRIVTQKMSTPTADDVTFLTFRSGYTNMDPGGCTSTDTDQTVDQCLALPATMLGSLGGKGVYGDQDPTTVGKFYYNSGHMTVHASKLMGLGDATTTILAEDIAPPLAADNVIDISYSQVDLAGGIGTSAGNYSIFLRNILGGQLQMINYLSADAVCTNPADPSCVDSNGQPAAIYSPIDGPNNSISNESWHYSLGHWIEDDPTKQSDGTTLGDGSFSSPGAFGFYPWIDSTATYYGIVARVVNSGYYESMSCGRQIRKAFLTGVVPGAPTLPPLPAENG